MASQIDRTSARLNAPAAVKMSPPRTRASSSIKRGSNQRYVGGVFTVKIRSNHD